MAEVKITGINKTYDGGTPVLTDLELNIRSGELFFLLGPSGCGKSTLLRILAGLLTPDSGTITFDGEDVTALPPEKRHAAMVFQNYALWPHLNVFDNVAFGLRSAGIGGRELKTRVGETLELVRMEQFAKRRIAALSGGQQQRVALARALAVDPAILLLDEPLSNLDARLRDTMRGEIKRICRERKLTALYVTHDRQEAFSLADRAAIMDGGVIRQQGTPEELYDFPVNRFCAEFLGDVNLISGAVSQRQFVSELGTFPLQSAAPEGDAAAMLRPERLRLVTTPPEGWITFPARITGRQYCGESTEWRCRTALSEVKVKELAPPERHAGDQVVLGFDPRYLVILPEK